MIQTLSHSPISHTLGGTALIITGVVCAKKAQSIKDHNERLYAMGGSMALVAFGAYHIVCGLLNQEGQDITDAVKACQSLTENERTLLLNRIEKVDIDSLQCRAGFQPFKHRLEDATKKINVCLYEDAATEKKSLVSWSWNPFKAPTFESDEAHGAWTHFCETWPQQLRSQLDNCSNEIEAQDFLKRYYEKGLPNSYDLFVFSESEVRTDLSQRVSKLIGAGDRSYVSQRLDQPLSSLSFGGSR